MAIGEIPEFESMSTADRKTDYYCPFLYSFARAAITRDEWTKVVESEVTLSAVLSESHEAFLILNIMNNWRMEIERSLPRVDHWAVEENYQALLEFGGPWVRNTRRPETDTTAGPRWTSRGGGWSREGFEEYERLLRRVEEGRRVQPSFDVDFAKYCKNRKYLEEQMSGPVASSM